MPEYVDSVNVNGKEIYVGDTILISSMCGDEEIDMKYYKNITEIQYVCEGIYRLRGTNRAFGDYGKPELKHSAIGTEAFINEGWKIIEHIPSNNISNLVWR